MSVWVGGLIALGGIVAGLRRAQVDRPILKVVARSFSRVSWGALAVAILSGGWMAIDHIGEQLLAVKMGLVALSAGLAAHHQFVGPRQTPRTRGIVQGLILVSSLATVWVAVLL